MSFNYGIRLTELRERQATVCKEIATERAHLAYLREQASARGVKGFISSLSPVYAKLNRLGDKRQELQAEVVAIKSRLRATGAVVGAARDRVFVKLATAIIGTERAGELWTQINATIPYDQQDAVRPT